MRSISRPANTSTNTALMMKMMHSRYLPRLYRGALLRITGFSAVGASMLMLASCSAGSKPVTPGNSAEFSLLAGQISKRINDSEAVFEFAQATRSSKVAASSTNSVQYEFSGAHISRDGQLLLKLEQTSSSTGTLGRMEMVTTGEWRIPLSKITRVAVIAVAPTDLQVQQVDDAKLASIVIKSPFKVSAFVSGKNVHVVSTIRSSGIAFAPSASWQHGGAVAMFQTRAAAQSFAKDFHRLVTLLKNRGAVGLEL